MTPEQLETIARFPYKPRMCVWELTLACNLRCGHCGSRAGVAREDEMTTDECLAVVADLAALGCEVITLSGGEPTLHPGWREIARAIRAAGMIPNIVTNGVHCTPEMARDMKECGLSNAAVSLDGPADVHETIRGPGTFAKTCAAVATIQEAGLPVTIMTTINQLNLPHLETIYDLCVSMGVDRWRLQLGKPMGNLGDHEDWVIEPREILYVLPRLHRLAERGPVKVGIGDSLGFHSVYDIPLRATSWKGTPQHWGGCQAGMLGIGIESDGGIKGCLSMQSGCQGPHTFREGSVRERSLFEIWTDPNLFAYNRRFALTDLTGACATCAHGRTCRGGAHCVSIAVSGTTTENPYCYYMLAERARKSPLGRMKNQVAAAAAMLFAGAGVSCVPPVVEPTYGVDPCEDVQCCAVDIDPETYDQCCEDACCNCDYGSDPCEYVQCSDPDLTIYDWEQCCNMDYGSDPCHLVDCQDPQVPQQYIDQCCNNMDYGVDPCTDADCADPNLPPETFEICCSNMEYGVDPCESVCCECDYGEIPPELQYCCEVPPEKK
ncbi:radical SAM protein [Myxococcota bacterium]|nr:radical SAM protein [Myxococcota bacterium]MBU1412054.1 radical SAM protein [Myxococcota bacterium]MBU1510560.1 radical SAM protein [Myxococcota bacterium]